jgi:predicted DNA-binding transcriptional regulator AlpA
MVPSIKRYHFFETIVYAECTDGTILVCEITDPISGQEWAQLPTPPFGMAKPQPSHDTADKQPTKLKKKRGKSERGEMANGDTLLTEREVAEQFKVSMNTLARWRLTGDGPKYKKLGDGKGARVRYRQADVDAYIEEHVWSSTSEQTVSEQQSQRDCEKILQHELLTSEELAQVLGIDKGTPYQWYQNRRTIAPLHPLRVGKDLRWRSEEVRALLESQKKGGRKRY